MHHVIQCDAKSLMKKLYFQIIKYLIFIIICLVSFALIIFYGELRKLMKKKQIFTHK